MTDPTSKQLEMARRIAADTWGLTGPNRQAVINGEWDDIRQVRCALAAIIETSERAAKIAASDHLILSESRSLGSFGRTRKDHGQLISAAIRKGDHLDD